MFHRTLFHFCFREPHCVLPLNDTGVVPRGVEPAIKSLKVSCPKPLDDGTINAGVHQSAHMPVFNTFSATRTLYVELNMIIPNRTEFSAALGRGIEPL